MKGPDELLSSEECNGALCSLEKKLKRPVHLLMIPMQERKKSLKSSLLYLYTSDEKV